MRRQVIESLERRKEMMIAALWANSGFEGEEGSAARKESIEQLEENFQEAVVKIMSGVIEEEEEIDYEDNPFFAAAKRGTDKINVTEGANIDGLVKDTLGEYTTDQ